MEKNLAVRVRKELDSVVADVENQIHEVILTAVESVVLTKVEVAVRSITGSSRHGPNSVVLNTCHRDFCGNMEDAPLVTATSLTD